MSCQVAAAGTLAARNAGDVGYTTSAWSEQYKARHSAAATVSRQRLPTGRPMESTPDRERPHSFTSQARRPACLNPRYTACAPPCTRTVGDITAMTAALPAKAQNWDRSRTDWGRHRPQAGHRKGLPHSWGLSLWAASRGGSGSKSHQAAWGCWAARHGRPGGGACSAALPQAGPQCRGLSERMQAGSDWGARLDQPGAAPVQAGFVRAAVLHRVHPWAASSQQGCCRCPL